ncbi:hypothetical protein JD969_14780 [Planctomycetota bacterium]|nr:hypothetical protein JD969_14780 [Planctomycetota bacterium]
MNMIAKCDVCDSITFIGPKKGKAENSEELYTKPTNYQIDSRSHGFRMVQTWFSGGYVLIFLISLIFLTVPLMLFRDEFIALFTKGQLPDEIMPFIIFGGIFSCVGWCMFYSGITGLINRTVYTVEFNELRIKHGPLPWRGNKRLIPSQIKKLDIKKSSVEVNGEPRWNLFAKMINDKKIMIAARLEKKSYALYLQKILNEQLGLSEGEKKSSRKYKFKK